MMHGQKNIKKKH